MREKTSSVTQLVKIIAKEEVLKILKEYNLHEKIKLFIKHKNSGDFWNNAEDDILKLEFSNAIKRIANTHGRTFGAIISRLHQKDLY